MQLRLGAGDGAMEFPEPRLQEYDLILLNSSGGKDSQVMIGRVVELADGQGVGRDRLVVVHAELGRVEWEGTLELAREQAEAYGLSFRSVKRRKGDLLEHVESRGMWPGPATRYCTSDHKRGPISTVLTALDRERRTGDSFTVLNCLGFRAEESPARRKRSVFSRNTMRSTKTRTVIDWLPIHHWSEAEVWQSIARSGVRHHAAYDEGMPRLSCVFCIFAPKSALVLAGSLNPELLAEYVRVERKIGHRFRVDLSLADVQAAVDAGESVGEMNGSWNM